MSDPYCGEIRLVGFDFAPTGWALCDGSLLPIAQYVELFSLIGTTYGGDGQTTFALPDLRGRALLGAGAGPGLSSYVVGESGGVEAVVLSVAQVPPHGIPTSSAPATRHRPTQTSSLAGGGAYAPLGSADTALASVGGGQSHENMPPFLTMSYIICLFGIFPSQT